MPAFWFLSNNFGDALNPYLLSRLSGRPVVWAAPDDPREKLLAIGSILSVNVVKGIAWGCGFANRFDRVTDSKRVIATRGHLSARMLSEQGLPPIGVCGDPALLLPEFIPSAAVVPSRKLGIVPHYVDARDVIDALPDLPEEWSIINVLSPIEEVVRGILECERLVSSSLHGLIVSHAYGRPCLWVRFGDRLLGDGTKFADYFTTVSADSRCYSIRLSEGTEGFRRLEERLDAGPTVNVDTQALRDAFPYPAIVSAR